MTTLVLALALACLLAAPAGAAAIRLVAPVGEQGSDVFGIGLARLGDVNGDGADDFAVGAPGYSASRGRVYIYWGGALLDSIADFVLTGQPSQPGGADNFGRSVAGAGDVNDDGYADVIVGARNHDTNGNDAGRAYVFFGGPAMDDVADWTTTGFRNSDQYGQVVDGIGDLDGDGFDDFAVSAHRHDGGATQATDDRGRVFVYRGGVAPDVFADWILTGAQPGDQLGYSMSRAGDVNGDGRPDLLLGAFGSDAGGAQAGRAYVYFGGAAPDTFPDLVFTGSPGDSLGRAVAGGGDVNGDGWADLIVASPMAQPAGPASGAVHVYFGGPGADPVADLVLPGTAPFDQLGFAVGNAGDVDGDGYDDVIAGALFHDGDGPLVDVGFAYVWRGGPVPDAVADWTIEGEAANDQLGFAVAGVGDVNDDGRADFAAGAHQNDHAAFNAGRAYVYAAPRQVPGMSGWGGLAMAGLTLLLGAGALARGGSAARK